MPQMGESVAEGTIVRWIKKVGDVVERDEPLFEISTDKVDAEIPSPAAGVLSEIKVKEGETVPVNSVVAVIGEASGASRVRDGSSRVRRLKRDRAEPVAKPPPARAGTGACRRSKSPPCTSHPVTPAPSPLACRSPGRPRRRASCDSRPWFGKLRRNITSTCGTSPAAAPAAA